jgi:hypothetical protein
MSQSRTLELDDLPGTLSANASLCAVSLRGGILVVPLRLSSQSSIIGQAHPSPSPALAINDSFKIISVAGESIELIDITTGKTVKKEINTKKAI